MKFGRNVLHVNTHQLTESVFWFNVKILKWQPWCHFTQKSAATWYAKTKRQSAARLSSSIRQFPINSTFELVTHASTHSPTMRCSPTQSCPVDTKPGRHKSSLVCESLEHEKSESHWHPAGQPDRIHINTVIMQLTNSCSISFPTSSSLMLFLLARCTFNCNNNHCHKITFALA